MNSDARRQIQVGWECLRGVLEADMKSDVASLNSMEAVNNDAIIKFRDLDVYCHDLLKNTEGMKEMDDKLHGDGAKELQDLENQLDKLLVIATQLDHWSEKLQQAQTGDKRDFQ